MVTLYLGVVEISQGIGADRKVTMTARTIADLVAQTSSINNSDMTNSLNAATAVMAPFPDSNLKVTVTERGHRRATARRRWPGATPRTAPRGPKAQR